MNRQEFFFVEMTHLKQSKLAKSVIGLTEMLHAR